jgi:hypothetical protein
VKLLISGAKLPFINLTSHLQNGSGAKIFCVEKG